MRSPAQILFERLIQTWIRPHVVARRKQNPSIGPIPVRIALIVWKQSDSPTILLNDEVVGAIIKMKIITAGPVKRGQPVTSDDIGGIQSVVLTRNLASSPYIVLVQGRSEKFHLASRNMDTVASAGDFEVHASTLATEGLVLAGKYYVNVFIDLIRNGYESAQTREEKGRELDRLVETHFTSKVDARTKAKRHLRLPTLTFSATMSTP